MLRRVLTPPTAEPIALSEVRDHLRLDVDDHSQDNLLAECIVAARENLEHCIARGIMPQDVRYDLTEAQAGDIVLPEGRSVTSIHARYAGSWSEVSSALYTFDAPSLTISPVSTWPAHDAMRITVAGGYATLADVPESLRRWLLLRVGTLYENREDFTAEAVVRDTSFARHIYDPFIAYRGK